MFSRKAKVLAVTAFSMLLGFAVFLRLPRARYEEGPAISMVGTSFKVPQGWTFVKNGANLHSLQRVSALTPRHESDQAVSNKEFQLESAILKQGRRELMGAAAAGLAASQAQRAMALDY